MRTIFEQDTGTIRFNRAEFPGFLAEHARDNGLQAYHLTTVYKNAQTARAADRALQRAKPKILSKLVAGNWTRAAKRGKLVGISFLDTAGSRGSSSQALAPTTAQRDFHHHSILLVSPKWATNIDQLASSSSVEIEENPALSPFRRRMARSSARLLRRLKLMLVTDDLVRDTPIRSIEVQRFPDQEDVERAANYAAKSLHRLSVPFPDEAYSVLTQMRQRPARKVPR